MTYDVVEETTFKINVDGVETMSASTNPKSDITCVCIQTDKGQQVIYLSRDKVEMLHDLIQQVIWAKVG